MVQPDLYDGSAVRGPRSYERMNVVMSFGFSIRWRRQMMRPRPGGAFSFVEVTQPPNPVLRVLYGFYLSRVVPVMGVLLVSDPVEYRMLHRYLRAYGDGSWTTDALASHPGIRVERRLLFFGCATSWSGTRLPSHG
ncbi:class I SAM-dependent methyltransferase [uncultured Amnibacterium sp.]|uniref:class I SAM-dependent methyltransferase n=1 Tax=uncultured Amnibacterium sp. TaxID=1631851 RepID=UPI0035CAC1CB